MVKSKFFSVFFAFALLIPCLFALAACNNNNKSLKDNEIAITVADKVYDGQAIAVTATATSGQTPTVVYKLAGADDSTYTTTAPKDVGDYTVSAGVVENEEYKAAVNTKNFSITAKQIALAWTAPVNLAYDKQAKVASVQPSGILEGDDCSVQAALTQGQNNVNAGSFTYTASLSGAAAKNYSLQNSGVSPQWTITPLEVTINWTEPSNLVYDNQAKEPTVEVTAGLLDGDLCDVQKILTDGKDNVNVGTFTFTANGLTNPNYKLPQNAVSPEYTITPIILSDLHAEFIYNGEAVQEQDLSMLYADLSIEITFDSANVGASIDDYAMLMNGDLTENYDINLLNCTAAIVQREVTLNWTAPANLKFNNQAKVPTVTAGNLAAGEIDVTVNAELTGGENNVNIGESFTFTATSLTGSNASNYKLPDITTSNAYEIVIDSLELNAELTEFGNFVGEAWFAIPVQLAGLYETRTQGFPGSNKQSLWTFNGVNFTQASTLNKGYHDPNSYICFSGANSTTYYLKIEGNNSNSSLSGSVQWVSHDHNYDYYSNIDTCYCGAFRGTTLTLGETATNIYLSAGETIKFRFQAESGHKYYMTQSLLGADSADYSIAFDVEGDQSFEENFGFGSSNAAEATYDEWVYIYYTAPAAVENGSFTVNELIV